MNIIKKILSWFKTEQSNISEYPDLFRKKSALNLAEDYNDTEPDVKIDIGKEIDNLIRKLSLIKDRISMEEDLKELNYKKLLKRGRKKISI
jgi:hypothetical protein